MPEVFENASGVPLSSVQNFFYGLLAGGISVWWGWVAVSIMSAYDKERIEGRHIIGKLLKASFGPVLILSIFAVWRA